MTRSVAISVEARDPGGRYRDLLRPVVRVQAADDGPVDVPVRQVAPGRYETSVVADATRRLTITMAGTEAGGATGVASRVVLPDPAAGYRFRPADEALLRSIASATGGAWRPSAASLAAMTTDHRARHRPLWPALLAFALALWFVNLVLRRVRLFESDAVYATSP